MGFLLFFSFFPVPRFCCIKHYSPPTYSLFVCVCMGLRWAKNGLFSTYLIRSMLSTLKNTYEEKRDTHKTVSLFTNKERRILVFCRSSSLYPFSSHPPLIPFPRKDREPILLPTFPSPRIQKTQAARPPTHPPTHPPLPLSSN